MTSESEREEALVFADQLMEAGDVRGELIALEWELTSSRPGDERHAHARARLGELRDRAKRAWQKELGHKRRFALEGGLPVLEVELVAKRWRERNQTFLDFVPPELPDVVWLRALQIAPGEFGRTDRAAASGQALAMVLQLPQFKRVRRLSVAPIAMTYGDLQGLCLCEEVRALETLDIDLLMQVPAVLFVLRSTSFERLTSLTIAVRHRSEIPRGSVALAPPPDGYRDGFDRLDGLPALRRLYLGAGILGEPLRQLLRSPLVRRLGTLRVLDAGELPALDGVSLPNLKCLVVHSSTYVPILPRGLETLVQRASLPALARLDLADAVCDGDVLAPLADGSALPSLVELDVSSRYRYHRTEARRAGWSPLEGPRTRWIPPGIFEKLRARFGARLIAEGVHSGKRPPPRPLPWCKWLSQ
jgi:hypothetical protein